METKIAALPGMGDMLRRTGALYGKRLGASLGILIGAGVAGALVVFVLSSAITFIADRVLDVSIYDHTFQLILAALVGLVVLFIVMLAQGALIYALSSGGIDFKDALTSSWKRKWSFLWLVLLSSILTIGGYVLFVVPGVILLVWFSVAFFAFSVDGEGGMQALMKSREYVRGRGLAVFGRLFTLWLMTTVLYVITSYIAMRMGRGGLILSLAINLLMAPFIYAFLSTLFDDLKKAGPVREDGRAQGRDKLIAVGVGSLGSIILIVVLAVVYIIPPDSSLGQTAAYRHIMTWKEQINRTQHDVKSAFSEPASEVLHQAIEDGSLWNLRLQVMRGADLNAVDTNLGTPLTWLVNSGWPPERTKQGLSMVKFLLDHGADVNVKGYDGKTALALASEHGSLAIVQLLLERGADVNIECREGETALSLAASGYGGNTAAIMKLLLEKKARIDVKNQQGVTPLRKAVQKGNGEAIKVLLENHADLNMDRQEANRLLRFAAGVGNVETVQTILKQGGNINYTDTDDRTALIETAEAGNVEMAKLLLSHGAKLEKKNGVACTALCFADAHYDMAKFLMEQGASAKVVTTDGTTLLMMAAINGHVETVKLFKSCGVDINAKNAKGETALHIIAGKRTDKDAHPWDRWDDASLDMIKLLLSQGADVNACTKEGRTPLMHALDKPAAVRLLVEKGTDLNVKDKDGDTALMYTAQSGFPETAKILVEKGADINAKNNNGWTALKWATESLAQARTGASNGDFLNEDVWAKREKDVANVESILKKAGARE